MNEMCARGWSGFPVDGGIHLILTQASIRGQFLCVTSGRGIRLALFLKVDAWKGLLVFLHQQPALLSLSLQDPAEALEFAFLTTHSFQSFQGLSPLQYGKLGTVRMGTEWKQWEREACLVFQINNIAPHLLALEFQAFVFLFKLPKLLGHLK